MDVLVIYQFCTFGGVERVILNRAKVFKKHGLDVKISIGYLFDYGGLQSFRSYIRINRLEDHLATFIIPESSLDWEKFDFIFVIDTPQVFDRIGNSKKVLIECHTPYRENRQYLKDIPKSIQGILVPSESFRALVASEFPDLPPISVMPNCVSDEFFEIGPSTGNEYFSKRPITYFARVEDLKNFIEATRIFELFTDTEDVMFFVVGKGADEKMLIRSLERKGLIEKSLLRDRIDFDSVTSLVSLVKRHRGVFLSPSKGESFGLSAAEFISGGVPVLLSDIPPHKELVDNDERFLYNLGSIASAETKMVELLRDWENMSEQVKTHAGKFREDAFLKAWQKFLADQKS